jgi:predicted amidohydrolase YtcJ
VTDATPTNGEEEHDLFARAVTAAALLQRVVLMGTEQLPRRSSPTLSTGAVKIVIADHEPRSPDAVAERVRAAHDMDRAVAVHCVTRAALVVALAAFSAAGPRPGDRIEHASVTPPDAVPSLSRLGLTVVTQPNFVAERGDEYLRDVDADDVPWLYRAAGLLVGGIPVGGGTDAPFGHPDPWRAMRAAVERTTPSGQVLGPEERLTPEQALALFTSGAARPGGPARAIERGAVADLCLLYVPWRDARRELSDALVRTTIRDGRIVAGAG